jgi:hypothetical protein
MPDTSEPRATLPFPSGPAEAAEAAPPDPLAGDWAEGLRGPTREVPIERPTRLRGQSVPTPRPLAALPPEQRTEQADLRILAAMSEALRTEPAPEAEVEAPDAWGNTDDQLASVPPPAREQAEAAPPIAEAPLAASKPPDTEPTLPAFAAPHDAAEAQGEALHPLTAEQLAAEPGAATAAAAEPASEEVLLLSDAELAEDEPPAAAAPAAETAPVEAAATAEAVAAVASGPVPIAEAPAVAAAASESAPMPLALAAAVEPLALPAPAGADGAALPAVALALPAAPEEQALPAAAAAPALGAAAGPATLPAPAAEASLPAVAAPVALPSEAPPSALEASPEPVLLMGEDAPPLGFRVPGLAVEPAPDLAATAPEPAAAGAVAAAPDPLAAAAHAAPTDLASELASDLDVALGPVESATTGESAPLPMAAPDAPVPAEGMRAVFAAPAVSASEGWAKPEAPPHVTSETLLNLESVHHDAGPDATVHEGAPITLPAAAAAPAAKPLPDEDLESTVLSLALEAMQRPAPAAAPEAIAAAAAPAEEEIEQLPEDAIAEPLPEDAIAGTADPAAPWNHAEIEVTPHGAPPVAHTPWDTHATPEWRAEAASGEWAGSGPQASTPWNASAAPAAEGWPGAAAPAAAADSWGAPAAPAPAVHAAWGEAPAAAPAHDTWGAPPTAVAPAAAQAGTWGAPAPAPAPVVASWATEPAGPFSADKLVSSPGASDWLIEAAPPPAAAAWESAKPATGWDAPAAAATGGWEAKTQAAFPVAVPDAPSGSPFAPLAPGASLSAEEPVITDHVVEHSLDDADLPVPIYEVEPALHSSHLAVAGEHRVAVHTRAGRTRRGIVKDVDLAGTGFSLQPQSGTGVPESVQAAEVKAIFFMLPPGEKPAPGGGAKVRVTFEDGRTIEGQRDGADAPEGFFLVPSDAARTNTRRIFVARAAVQDLREG